MPEERKEMTDEETIGLLRAVAKDAKTLPWPGPTTTHEPQESDDA